jgi:hypothetical protein
MTGGFTMGIIELLLARANTATVTKSGNDSTATIGGNPFQTINGAISAILASNLQGITILVYPGTYDEIVTLPEGNSLKGISAATVILSKNVSATTTLLTMSNNTSIEDVSLQLTSASHVGLIGIAFPNTSTQSASARGVNVTIDNTAAGISGTSNVYGVHSFGTGLPSIGISNLDDSSVTVRSAGLGNKRGILVNVSAQKFNCRNSVIQTANSGGAGSYIGAEVNQTGAFLNLIGCTVGGQTADISQSAGTLTIGSTQLMNATANTLGFSTYGQPTIFVWAQPGVIGLGTNFYRPGTAALTSSEVVMRISQKCIVKKLNIRSLVSPGLGTTVNWTVRKNGADTSLTASMSGSQISTINNDVSVTYEAGDTLSLKVSTALVSTIADTVVQVDIL